MMIHCDYSSEDDLRHTANKTMAMGMKRKSMNDLPIEHFSRLSKEELIERVVQLERERQQNHPILESSDDEESLSHVCRWDNCFLSMSTLEELTNHIRITHVGSGKVYIYIYIIMTMTTIDLKKYHVSLLIIVNGNSVLGKVNPF